MDVLETFPRYSILFVIEPSAYEKHCSQIVL